MEPLYENIKNTRKLRGLTQQQLAEMVGYNDRSTVARIEAGEIDLPQSKIKQFADALGVSPAYLMGWTSDGSRSVDIEHLLSYASALSALNFDKLIQRAEELKEIQDIKEKLHENKD